MKVLVTGATGFVGGHLVGSLLDQGHDVRCLVRSQNRLLGLDMQRIEFCSGDVTDRASVTGATSGIEVVYHLAAIGNVSSVSQDSYDAFSRVNVQGTKNLLDACSSSTCLSRFVYVSSLAAMGLIIQDRPIDEAAPCMPKTPYEKSKCEAEAAVNDYHRQLKVPTTIVRPSMVYGQGDVKSEVLRMARMIKRHMFPIIGTGETLIPMVFVGNLVQGMMLAAAKAPSVGQTYIITDSRSYSWNEIVSTIAEELGVKRWGFHAPVWVAKVGVGSLEKLAGILRFTPPFTLERIRSSTSNRVYDISKARGEIGYEPVTSIQQGLRDTVRWYRQQSLL